MTYYVQEFRGGVDLNSPPFSGQVGSLVAVLNACLVDGWGTIVSVTGITRSGTTATATVSAADGLKVIKTGMVITIAGATGADASLYNGTFTITAASATTFTYTMSGTPTGSATGTITASTYLPITSITRGGTGNLTATVTLASHTNATLLTGTKVTISGCTGTGASQFNGTFSITYVSPTSFTYQMASDPGADASGSPVYAKAPLQWTRPFAAGTNAQTYLSQATLGAAGEAYTPRYLQVIDNGVTAGGAKEANVWGAEVMSADQTANNGGGADSGRFPTTAQMANGACLRKSVTADTVQRNYTMIGDEKFFKFVAHTGDTGNGYEFSFGYFVSNKPSDPWNTLISGGVTFNSANSVQGGNVCLGAQLAPAQATAGMWAARDYAGSGSAVVIGNLVLAATTAGSLIGQAATAGACLGAAAHGPDNGYWFWPILLAGSATVIRGRVLGLYAPAHSVAFAHGDIIPNPTNLASTSLRIVQIQSGNGVIGQMAYDLLGPWV